MRKLVEKGLPVHHDRRTAAARTTQGAIHNFDNRPDPLRHLAQELFLGHFPTPRNQSQVITLTADGR